MCVCVCVCVCMCGVYVARNFTVQCKPVTWLHIRITSARLYIALYYTESCNLLQVQTRK